MSNLLNRTLNFAKKGGVMGGFLVILLVSACGSPSSEPATPTSASQPTLAVPAETGVPDDVAETPTSEATGESTDESTSEQIPDDDRVAAPTFDPAVNQIGVEPFVEGFDQPLFLTHAGDESGRIFVVEKEGTIRIVREGAMVETPFLDIRDRVSTRGNEQGLLGLAFPPNFEESGYFFVHYSDLSGNTAISRFQVEPVDGDVADAASEFSILQIAQPARNHNGGMLAFGPDDYLWIGMGDGGGGGDTYGNGQNPATLLGKMLRIDVTSDPAVPYVIPADNPWVSAQWNGADVLDEVWAVGLRNPWRYSFDRHTGDLWIADVGQNALEEVNYTVAGTAGGLNYGWPIMEGTQCYERNCDPAGLVLPVVEYDRGGGCSITGGYVYRGSEYPMLQGVYLFGDYCSGNIWAAIPNADGSWHTTQMASVNATISSFGEDENGELYLTDLGGGTIYRVTGQ